MWESFMPKDKDTLIKETVVCLLDLLRRCFKYIYTAKNYCMFYDGACPEPARREGGIQIQCNKINKY